MTNEANKPSHELNILSKRVQKAGLGSKKIDGNMKLLRTKFENEGELELQANRLMLKSPARMIYNPEYCNAIADGN